MQYFKNKLRSIAKKGFIGNIGILVGGTAIAQLINILILPILTRLYSPEAFNALALYVAILSILVTIASLKFETAIPLPKSNKIAKNLLLLSLISVFLLSITTLIILILYFDKINQLTNQQISSYLLLLPIGMLISGCYNTFLYWSIRTKCFTLISKTRVRQSISSSASQISIGIFQSSALGLIIGQLLNMSTGIISLIKQFYSGQHSLLKGVTKTTLQKTFCLYNHFPKYITLESLCNSMAIQLPIILIASYAIGPEAGYLMLAIKLLSAPMSLIGGSISQVYFSEASEKHHQKKLQIFTHSTLLTLTKLSLPPLIIIALCAPLITPIFLGIEWSRTGTIICWLTPYFFIQLLASSISTSLYITNNQKIALILQILGLIFRVISIIIMGNYNPNMIVETYAISGGLFYTVYLIVILKCISIQYKPIIS